MFKYIDDSPRCVSSEVLTNMMSEIDLVCIHERFKFMRCKQFFFSHQLGVQAIILDPPDIFVNLPQLYLSS